MPDLQVTYGMGSASPCARRGASLVVHILCIIMLAQLVSDFLGCFMNSSLGCVICGEEITSPVPKRIYYVFMYLSSL